MRRVLATVMVTLALLAATQGHERLEEDMPGWDCRTMGNRDCG